MERRRIFLNFADIGGRYSALTYFGLLPATLLGVDVEELLVRAIRMQHACASSVPARDNPGLRLGAVLGELGVQGRNKVTFIMPDSLQSLGMWLEQLLAESTGKEGTGLLPVAGEQLKQPNQYGNDRIFVAYDLAGNKNEAQEQGVAALVAAGHPVVHIVMQDELDLGQEFFRWEFATAVAGSILGINAFDQPNVQESKDVTQHLLGEVHRRGRLPELKPTLEEDGFRIYGNDSAATLEETFKKFIDQAHSGDYFALLAYLDENPKTDGALDSIRLGLGETTHLPVTIGYGPRYLHSTGQFHKGGPDTGLFIELTQDEDSPIQIPGRGYSFGVFNLAQAQGDYEALLNHKRRVIRVHLGKQVGAGLVRLSLAVKGEFHSA